MSSSLYLATIAQLAALYAPLASNDAYISEQLARQDLKGKRLESFIAGRSLLKYAWLRAMYPKALEGLDFKDTSALKALPTLPEIECGVHGKPSFKDSSWHFNLSHSRGLLVLATGPHPQGIDLEVVKPLAPRFALIQQVLTPNEFEHFADLAIMGREQLRKLLFDSKLCKLAYPYTPSQLEFFLREWTLREALVKCVGSSVFALENFNVDLKNQYIYFDKLGTGEVLNWRLADLLQLATSEALGSVQRQIFSQSELYKLLSEHTCKLADGLDIKVSAYLSYVSLFAQQGGLDFAGSSAKERSKCRFLLLCPSMQHTWLDLSAGFENLALKFQLRCSKDAQG